MSDKMSIDKEEHCQEHSEESVASTPDNGPEPTPTPQDTQPVKRKGGRKPVRKFSSSDEAEEGQPGFWRVLQYSSRVASRRTCEATHPQPPGIPCRAYGYMHMPRHIDEGACNDTG